MFTLRTTAKLLKRMRIAGSAQKQPPTTALGDWYANLLRFGTMQMVLCTSERSLLSVVLPARQMNVSLVSGLRAGLRQALHTIGVTPAAIERELAEMQCSAVAGTESRSVLGSMNDFAVAIEYRLRREPNTPLSAWSEWLAETRCSPLGYEHPRLVAKRLLDGEGRLTTGCS